PSEDPAEREVVRWLFRRYAAAETSLRALALELNRKGVPSPGRGSKRHPGVGEWCTNQVKRILTNPVYAGDLRYGARSRGKYRRLAGAEFVPVEPGTPARANPDPYLDRDAHAGVIDRALWDRVQAKVAARRAQGQRTRAAGYVLSGGLARC